MILAISLCLFLLLLTNQPPNYITQSILLKSFVKNINEDHPVFIDSSGLLKSSLSPNLRWCTKNPFLQSYDQKLILELETKWVKWNGDLLFTTHELLKNYALKIGNAVGDMVQVAYPISLPLPCPFKNNLTRIGGLVDGNKVLCGVELLQTPFKCIVYSLGSFGNFNFEWDLLKRTSCEIYTYDCTSSPPGGSTPRLTYHKICLGDRVQLQKFLYPYASQTSQQIFPNTSLFQSFDSIVKSNSHAEVHILKMDIEGGEYAVFTDLFRQGSVERNLPYQISFESHWWNRDIYHAILHHQMFSQLWKSGYRFLQHEHNPGDHSCVEWTVLRVFC